MSEAQKNPLNENNVIKEIETDAKLNIDQYIKQLKAHKRKMLPLIKFFKKHGLKFRHAKAMGSNVQYFRVDQLNQLIDDNKITIKASSSLYEAMKFLPNDVTYYQRKCSHPNFEYQQLLEPSENSGKFASFKYDINESRRWSAFGFILLFLGIFFPFFPFVVRYYVWACQLYLFPILIRLIDFRFAVYMLFRLFGYSFWIFPNLFLDYGILQRFQPVYSISRWDTRTRKMIFRLMALSWLGYYAFSIHKYYSVLPEISEIQNNIFNEFHDWGVSKIKGDQANLQQIGLIHLKQILNLFVKLFKILEEGTTLGQATEL